MRAEQKRGDDDVKIAVLRKFRAKLDLEKGLSKKTKAELIKDISTLCRKFPQVKEYYQTQTSEAIDCKFECKPIYVLNTR